ncbi:hypothetical protein B0O99DRAFT_502922 [Bisporella sp. PMI_857]|nr:hypothetical protein B0O99DRAFT_502922 [Bisporella sp. PMI_857]
MPELLNPAQPPPHAQRLREDAGRRLSRSPHPYHRQQYELPYSSERFSINAPQPTSSSKAIGKSNDENREHGRPNSAGYREPIGSDSGTEADDEHFLKGLPAPKLRPHKGLRGEDGSLSSSPSPLMSPGLAEEDSKRSRGLWRKATAAIIALKDDEEHKSVIRIQQKRLAEIVRRTTEGAILLFVGGILCFNSDVKQLLLQWKTEVLSQILLISTLILLYPIRVLRHVNPTDPYKRPLSLAIPVAFDPAPLFYPPALTMLVSTLVCMARPEGLLPSIILSIASLPRELIPSFGGLESSNTIQWLLSVVPLLLSKGLGKLKFIPLQVHSDESYLDAEILVLLAPLHQATCVTLHYLTTTSLLTAELQLLSIGLIDLLLLASSPQAVILKVLLWGGGTGVLVTCGHVLRWGVALARVPKWRFKRANFINPSLKGAKRSSPLNKLSTLFIKDPTASDTSEDEKFRSHPRVKPLKLDTTRHGVTSIPENGSASAIEPKSASQTPNHNGSVQTTVEDFCSVQRRHTLPALSSLPTRLSDRTPSGRRKRAASSSVQAFFNLTQTQATWRKWLYAAYVYACVLAIILVGIRDYVQRNALQGNEPIGWALGYLFGDNSWFRMEVVTTNLQRWICLPPRDDLENKESCHLGWVEHTRHSYFGEANTRLILSVYWLAIIGVGLAIVLKLSSIYEVDTRRKVFHFMMVGMLLPATFIDPTYAALALILMLAIFLLLDLFRASQLPPLSKSLASFLTPYVDGRDLKGPVVISHIFLLIGCAIPLWLSLGTLPRTGKDFLSGWEVPRREVSMVSGVICVGMGDAAASLIGRRYGRRKWLWGGGKSIEGSIAFATAVGLALVLAKIWLRIGGWPANNNDSMTLTIGKAGVAAGIASLTEAVLTGGNDNVVCPIILWLCAKGLDI